MVDAVTQNKKRKRSHADKRANKKKQEVAKGESKPVTEEKPEVVTEEKPAETTGKTTFYKRLSRSLTFYSRRNCESWFRKPSMQRKYQEGY